MRVFVGPQSQHHHADLALAGREVRPALLPVGVVRLQIGVALLPVGATVRLMRPIREQVVGPHKRVASPMADRRKLPAPLRLAPLTLEASGGDSVRVHPAPKEQ